MTVERLPDGYGQSVACPVCGAEVGAPCVWVPFRVSVAVPHPARVELAELEGGSS